MAFWAPEVDSFRGAIWKRIAYDENGDRDPAIAIEKENFRVFGFADGMQHETCCPGSGPIDYDDNRRMNFREIQRAFYTRYGKMWGMKTLGVTLPNGMIGYAYVCAVSHNDKGVVNMCGIEENLKNVLDDYRVGPLNLLPSLYCDQIFEPSEVIVIRGDNVGVYFDKMTGCRTKQEHHFGTFTNLFAILTKKLKFKIFQNRGGIVKRLMSYWFMLNIHTCFNGNTVSSGMDMRPPSIDEYLDGAIPEYEGNLDVPDDIPLVLL